MFSLMFMIGCIGLMLIFGCIDCINLTSTDIPDVASTFPLCHFRE